MTYDCHWLRRDEEERSGLAALREKIDVAVAARNEAADGRPLEQVREDMNYVASHTLVLGLLDEYEATRVSYFATNNSGMSAIVQAMLVLGMGQWTREQWIPWPEPDPDVLPDEVRAYLSHEEYLTHNPDQLAEHLPGFDPASVTEQHRAVMVELGEAADRVRAHVPSDVRGMCLDKFDSNDGWVVSARECEQAIRLWGCALTGSKLISLEGARVAAAEFAALDEAGRRERAAAAVAAVGLVELPLDEELVLLFGDAEWLEWLRFVDGAITHEGFSVW